jgi:predicted small lipoprotein YifL
MLKRIVMLVALAAALVACGSGTSSSPGAETVAPIDSAAPSASEMPSESAAPS